MSEHEKDKPKGLGSKYVVWEIEDGNIKEEVVGIANGSCRALTAAVERKLGKVQSRTMKSGTREAKQRTGK